MTAQASEHRCWGCGSVFYEDNILEYPSGKWYHQDCFESAVKRTFMCYEDGGEWAIQHHKDRQWWVAAMQAYLNYGGDDEDIRRLYEAAGG